MEQIVKLLTAAIIVTVFGLVLTFAFVDFSNNGGEYWGFDGHTEASVVAANSFEAGDYRYLYVKVKKPLGDTVHGGPYRIGCNFLDPSAEDYYRVGDYNFEGSVDSVKAVFAFAALYNQHLSQLLKAEFPTECGRQPKSK